MFAKNGVAGSEDARTARNDNYSVSYISYGTIGETLRTGESVTRWDRKVETQPIMCIYKPIIAP